ncbi:TPA: hypothetical protein R1B06_004507 [Escherichia coli]|nr:hypothetical protein [Klebsiella pneumoniae]HDC5041501.1 hypothetical protein [Escherichia coli]HEB9054784.1 hypothetical protein [Escherichia coli]
MKRETYLKTSIALSLIQVIVALTIIVVIGNALYDLIVDDPVSDSVFVQPSSGTGIPVVNKAEGSNDGFK